MIEQSESGFLSNFITRSYHNATLRRRVFR